MAGMAENPMESYALGDRFICDKCGETPRVLNGKDIEGGGPYTIKLKCHGETDVVTVAREELVHLQHAFKDGDGEAEES